MLPAFNNGGGAASPGPGRPSRTAVVSPPNPGLSEAGLRQETRPRPAPDASVVVPRQKYPFTNVVALAALPPSLPEIPSYLLRGELIQSLDTG